MVVVIGVIAVIIGALAAGKDLFASEDPPPRASESVPAVSRPVSPPDGDGGATATPSPVRTRTVSPEAESTPETSEPEGPLPESRVPLPGAATVPSSKPAPPSHTGPLIVRIDMGTTGKIGPNTWRARANPGANTVVEDAGGQLDTGCYVEWTLKRGSEVVHLARNGRCRPPGITLFNFEDNLREVGSYTLTADITTDWSQTGSKTIAFEVVPG